jgi:hypothetical protein
MTFPEACGGNLNEIPVGLQLVYRFCATISHPFFKSRHKLVQEMPQFTLIGDPAFYSFRNGGFVLANLVPIP